MILTRNEEANLRATLEGLSWASSILIVDSFSTDTTLQIADDFPTVRVIQHEFDHFADQCNHGLLHVSTPWVLSLDADYRCDASFEQELRELLPIESGYQASFQYGIYGKPLRATLYPPRTVLYRRDAARYLRDGHAHRVMIEGNVGKLRSPILHDDWKPLSAWLHAQIRYAMDEAEKLLNDESKDRCWKDQIRRAIVLAPALTLFYCLLRRGLILDGWRGIFYTMQRCLAEMILSLVILDRFLRRRSHPKSNPRPRAQ